VLPPCVCGEKRDDKESIVNEKQTSAMECDTQAGKETESSKFQNKVEGGPTDGKDDLNAAKNGVKNGDDMPLAKNVSETVSREGKGSPSGQTNAFDKSMLVIKSGKGGSDTFGSEKNGDGNTLSVDNVIRAPKASDDKNKISGPDAPTFVGKNIENPLPSARPFLPSHFPSLLASLASPSSKPPTDHTCAHLRKFWMRSGGLRDILSMRRYLSLSKDSSSSVASPCCHTCNGRLLDLHLCMHCVYVGCSKRGHLKSHQQQTNHSLSISVDGRRFHCGECGDYVYDWNLEDTLLEEEKKHAMRIRYMRTENIGWIPNEDEKRLLRACAKPVMDDNDTLGLRGMLNLGNSCFMTVVLQCIVQNPFIRNYFLGDKHHPNSCPKRGINKIAGTKASNLRTGTGESFHSNSEQGSNGSNRVFSSHYPLKHNNACGNSYSRDEKSLNQTLQLFANPPIGTCLACEMDQVVHQMFSGQTKPFSPHRFLYSMWMQAKHLSGYRQQDAHEFFSSVLNCLHKSCRGNDSNRKSTALPYSFFGGKSKAGAHSSTFHRRCSCIVHRIFGGSVRSDVTCLKCQHSSPSIEPMFYLCLDLCHRADSNKAKEMGMMDANSLSANSKEGAHNSQNADLKDQHDSAEEEKNSEMGSASLKLTKDKDGNENAKLVKDDSSLEGGDSSNKVSSNGKRERSKSPSPGNPRVEKKAKTEPEYLRFLTLEECLEAYVIKENLSKADSVFCSQCQAYEMCSKQIMIETLPPSFSFQLKRFSQDPMNRRWFKITSYISFPIDGLNLSKFLYRNRKGKRRSNQNDGFHRHFAQTPLSKKSFRRKKGKKGSEISIFENENENMELIHSFYGNGNVLHAGTEFEGESNAEGSAPQLYDLGSVVVHKGCLENGHYICYIRRENQWYKCDDTLVTKATIDEVVTCEAYLLFYVRRTIRK